MRWAFAVAAATLRAELSVDGTLLTAQDSVPPAGGGFVRLVEQEPEPAGVGMDTPHKHQCFCRKAAARSGACGGRGTNPRDYGSNLLLEKTTANMFLYKITDKKRTDKKHVFCCKTFTSGLGHATAVEDATSSGYLYRQDLDPSDGNSGLCHYHTKPRQTQALFEASDDAGTPGELALAWTAVPDRKVINVLDQTVPGHLHTATLLHYQARAGCNCNLPDHPYVEVYHGEPVTTTDLEATVALPQVTGEANFVGACSCGANVMAVYKAEFQSDSHIPQEYERDVHSTPAVERAVTYSFHDGWEARGA